MKVQTSRFGALEVQEKDLIELPEGLFGFENLKKYFVVDPSDDTMILWLQSFDLPEIAFPILEPKIFRPDYHVRLSASELRALRLNEVTPGETLVYAVLTVPEDPRQMTANLKAPIVINAKEGMGRQVVLQENEYSVKCSMYRELLAVIMSAGRKQKPAPSAMGHEVTPTAVSIREVRSQVEVSAL